jgi:hypothetical protein
MLTCASQFSRYKKRERERERERKPPSAKLTLIWTILGHRKHIRAKITMQISDFQ